MTSRPSPDSEIDALLAGHVLGDLDAAEREQLAHLLRQRPELQQRLDEFRTTLEVLPLALPDQEAPPARLRQRLLQGDRPRQEGAAIPRGARQAAPSWLVPSLMGLALVVLGVQMQQTRQQLASLRRQVQPPAATLASSRSLPLRAMTPSGHTTGAVIVTGAPTHNRLVLEGLPPAPPNHTYKLWARVNGREVGCVPFLPDAQGRVEMQIPTSPTSLASSVSVSLEPIAPAGEGPRGPRVLSSSI